MILNIYHTFDCSLSIIDFHVLFIFQSKANFSKSLKILYVFVIYFVHILNTLLFLILFKTL